MSTYAVGDIQGCYAEFRQLLDNADAEIMRAAEEELIFLQQINIHLPTDEPSIEKVIDMVHKLLETSTLNEEGQVAMSALIGLALAGDKFLATLPYAIQMAATMAASISMPDRALSEITRGPISTAR